MGNRQSPTDNGEIGQSRWTMGNRQSRRTMGNRQWQCRGAMGKSGNRSARSSCVISHSIVHCRFRIGSIARCRLAIRIDCEIVDGRSAFPDRRCVCHCRLLIIDCRFPSFRGHGTLTADHWVYPSPSPGAVRSGPACRRLRDPRLPRGRRHGRGLPGAGYAAGPARRHQVRVRRPGGGPRRVRAPRT